MKRPRSVPQRVYPGAERLPYCACVHGIQVVLEIRPQGIKILSNEVFCIRITAPKKPFETRIVSRLVVILAEPDHRRDLRILELAMPSANVIQVAGNQIHGASYTTTCVVCCGSSRQSVTNEGGELNGVHRYLVISEPAFHLTTVYAYQHNISVSVAELC
jgi:hypothetical protein